MGRPSDGRPLNLARFLYRSEFLWKCSERAWAGWQDYLATRLRSYRANRTVKGRPAPQILNFLEYQASMLSYKVHLEVWAWRSSHNCCSGQTTGDYILLWLPGLQYILAYRFVPENRMDVSLCFRGHALAKLYGSRSAAWVW